MEKELLEKRKVALNKLLENRADFWSGLCNFTVVLNTKNILTDEEYEIITDLLCEFRTTNAEARENYLNGGFFGNLVIGKKEKHRYLVQVQFYVILDHFLGMKKAN